MAHTPGPWEVWGEDECPEGIPVLEIGHGKIPSTECKQIAYVQCSMSDTDEFYLSAEDRDNAHLIAAAPKLLKALRNCLSLVELKFGNTDPTGAAAIEQARAAIARAKGETE